LKDDDESTRTAQPDSEKMATKDKEMKGDDESTRTAQPDSEKMATKDKEIKQRNERKNGRRNTEDIDAKEDIEEGE
jgi:hypothetical protein